jgi:hypothetical protein
LCLSSALSCSLVDSVDDYAGPPRTPAEAGPGGSVGIGGSDAATTCDAEEDCDDDNPCTIDSCFGSVCRHDADISATCDDGNPCNGQEVCTTAGECEHQNPPELDDENDCTVDSCDPAVGVIHDEIDYPDVKACGNTNCPANYYRASYLVCDTDCGGPNNCGFCINGSLCKRLCKKNHLTCCLSDNCPGSCPAGYSPGATSCSNDCGCGSCGQAVNCTRN